MKVIVRARPPLDHEHRDDALEIHDAVGEVRLRTGSVEHSFQFHKAISVDGTQEHVWEALRPAVNSALEGYNAAILAYGQTGAGKTYSMQGAAVDDGAIPRAVREIFEHVARCERGPNGTDGATFFYVRCSFLQIYQEAISDLLKPPASPLLHTGGSSLQAGGGGGSGQMIYQPGLAIREDRQRGLYVEGLSDWVVNSPAEVEALLRRGQAARATAATAANELSSRSHAVFCLTIEQSHHTPPTAHSDEPTVPVAHQPERIRTSKLNLVDLAGCAWRSHQ